MKSINIGKFESCKSNAKTTSRHPLSALPVKIIGLLSCVNNVVKFLFKPYLTYSETYTVSFSNPAVKVLKADVEFFGYFSSNPSSLFTIVSWTLKPAPSILAIGLNSQIVPSLGKT